MLKRLACMSMAAVILAGCSGKTAPPVTTNTRIVLSGSATFFANSNSTNVNQYTVTNRDKAPITVGSITATPSGLSVPTANNNCANTHLLVGDSCTFDVNFDGSAGAFSSGRITVNTDSGNNSLNVSGSVVPAAWQLQFTNQTTYGVVPLGADGNTLGHNGALTMQVAPASDTANLGANTYVLTGMTPTSADYTWNYTGGAFPGTSTNACELDAAIPAAGCDMQFNVGDGNIIGFPALPPASDSMTMSYTLNGYNQELSISPNFEQGYSMLAVAQPESGGSTLLYQVIPGVNPGAFYGTRIPASLPSADAWTNITPTTLDSDTRIYAVAYDSLNNQLFGNGEKAAMLMATGRDDAQQLWYLDVATYGVDRTKWETIPLDTTTGTITGNIVLIKFAYASGDVFLVTSDGTKNYFYTTKYSDLGADTVWYNVTPANPHQTVVGVSITNNDTHRYIMDLDRAADDSYHLLIGSLPVELNTVAWANPAIFGEARFNGFTPSDVFVSTIAKQTDNNNPMTALLGFKDDKVDIFTTSTAPGSISNTTDWDEHASTIDSDSTTGFVSVETNDTAVQDRNLVFTTQTGSDASTVSHIYAFSLSDDDYTDITPTLPSSTGWEFNYLQSLVNTYDALVSEQYQQLVVDAREAGEYNDKIYWRDGIDNGTWRDITPADYTTDQFTYIATDSHF